MSYMRQAKQNADNAEAAARLAAMEKEAEFSSLAQSAHADGAYQGYQKGLQEGEMQVAGIADALSRLLGGRQAPPDQGLASSYSQQGEDVRRQMVQDAQQEAFMRAQDMRDTSENNMNILLQEELKRRGL